MRTSMALGGALLSNLAPAQRPNILLLISDGWSWQGTEAIDRLGMRMPTFDRLQREGISFEYAFVASSERSRAYLEA